MVFQPMYLLFSDCSRISSHSRSHACACAHHQGLRRFSLCLTSVFSRAFSALLLHFGSKIAVTVLKDASMLYAASWVRDIGPDLRPNDYKKDDGTEGKSNGDKSRSTETEPSTLEDIAIAARGGMETLRPALQRLYMTRASAYRDALKSFIEGYQEGIQQVMEKKEDSSKAQ